MKPHHESKKLRRILLLGGAAALLSSCAGAPNTQSSVADTIFETNIVNDLNVTSGEPEIAINPKNPRELAVIDFGHGSAEAPSGSYQGSDIAKSQAASITGGRVYLSKDRGNTWAVASKIPPASDPTVAPLYGGGDPMIAYGPDGTIYALDETPQKMEPGVPRGQLRYYHVAISASTDGGKTWSKIQIAGSPVDRPWVTVDQSTGVLYTVSSGNLDAKTGVHNVPAPDAPNDRWLVAWQPHLTGKSEPHRIGGPDFSGSGGNTITAAHGVVAATFTLGGPAPGGAPAAGRPTSVPVPDSLKPLIKDGTTSCSAQAPCLFFETSTDQGQHWTRHHIPVAGGFSGQRAQVAADPGRPGRYAIAVLNPARTNFVVLVTDDSGATWSEPVTVPEAGSSVDFKQWMAYGPTGVLGLMWKDTRDDIPRAESRRPQQPQQQRQAAPGQPPLAGPSANQLAVEAAFDVYAAVSCDGGKTWPQPVRVNKETSASAEPGLDDLSYIALDANYAHLVWGDRRTPPRADGQRVVQTYYARVPFSYVSHGAACGRK